MWQGTKSRRNIQSVVFPHVQIQSLFLECFSQEELILPMKALERGVPKYSKKKKNHVAFENRGNKVKCTSGNCEKGEEESFSGGALQFTTVPSAVHVVAEVKVALKLSEKPFSLNKMDVISSSRL